MLLGSVIGLASAFVWATTSLAMKTHSERLDALSVNTFRMVVASIAFLLLLPLFGGLDAHAQMSNASRLALAVSFICGVAVGDTLYFWSMTKIGAARALPLSSIYPLFTWAIAVPFLNETVTWQALGGTALVLIGVYLLTPRAHETSHIDPRTKRIGTIAALTAALLWAISTTLLKVGMEDGVNVIVINSFRMPVGAVIMLAMLYWREGRNPWRGYNRHNIPMLIAVAIYSTVIGMTLWTLTVDYAGATRASLLVTVAPLIGVPLSVLFLKERITRAIALGTIISVAGIWLIL